MKPISKNNLKYINFAKYSVGFMGDNCDEEINECLDAKCVKSNTDYCEDGHLTFTCVCKPGFTGKIHYYTVDPPLSEL